MEPGRWARAAREGLLDHVKDRWKDHEAMQVLRSHFGSGVENRLVEQERGHAGRLASYLYQDSHCSLKAHADVLFYKGMNSETVC